MAQHGAKVAGRAGAVPLPPPGQARIGSSPANIGVRREPAGAGAGRGIDLHAVAAGGGRIHPDS